MRNARHLTSIVLLLAFAATCGANEPLKLRVLCYNIHYGQGMDGKYDVKRLADVDAGPAFAVQRLKTAVSLDRHDGVAPVRQPIFRGDACPGVVAPAGGSVMRQVLLASAGLLFHHSREESTFSAMASTARNKAGA